MISLAEAQRVDGKRQLFLVELLLPICVEELKHLLDHSQLPHDGPHRHVISKSQPEVV